MLRRKSTTPSAQRAHFLAVAAFIATTTTFSPGAKAQDIQTNKPELTAPIEPLRPGVDGNQIFAELLAQSEMRNAALLEYTALRTYEVLDPKGKVHAQEVRRMEYRAPGKKTFVVRSEEGSGLIPTF